MIAALLAVAVVVGGMLGAGAARAQTRRAFVMGVQNYSDNEIPRLYRSDTDAGDFAADIKLVGFDDKNVTLATDLRSRADFDKKFNTFLASVKEGDIVFFFYSGHGVGVEGNDTNYLLLADIKSLYAYTKSQMLEADRRRDDVVRLKMQTFQGPYETDEITKNGVSISDVMDAIGKKRPKIAVLFLDACRSLIKATGDAHEIDRGPATGSRLLPARSMFDGAMVVYSASYGESAIESFVGQQKNGQDGRRNSLFTEVLRSELQRPGQTLVELADRIGRMVSAYARAGGLQQEPEYFQNLKLNDDFALIPSIGAERFKPKDNCEGSQADWDEINLQAKPSRPDLERHARRFRDCPTGELAREGLAQLIVSSELVAPVRSVSRTIDQCDLLAAGKDDPTRPAEAPGVALANIDPDAAIEACETAVKHYPNTARYSFNLGQAILAQAQSERADDAKRKALLVKSRAAFNDAAKAGHVAAIYDLAVTFSSPDDSPEEQARSNELLKKAANQQYQPAMYELAMRYRDGTYGNDRQLTESYRWMVRAADGGYVKAKVEAAEDEFNGLGTPKNPQEAVRLAQLAADAGSDDAKLRLGLYYTRGSFVWGANGSQSVSLPPDLNQALLWFGRAAQANIPAAQYYLGVMMENGYGLPSPQPEIAERYYRLAAAAGDEDAEIELARRLRAGTMLAKPENGEHEAMDLLNRALSHGSARAAEILAEVYRNGELGNPKDPVAAVTYAFRAMRLSVLADPTVPDGNPFWEIDAGILLAEMGSNGEAVDANGHPLLNPDEIERLQKYYGKVNKDIGKVKVRSFWVPLYCGDYANYRWLWVWDWGRAESPTEPQFRSLERDVRCYDNRVLRGTFAASFAAARKADVPFADLVAQQIVSAKNEQDQTQRRR